MTKGLILVYRVPTPWWKVVNSLLPGEIQLEGVASHEALLRMLRDVTPRLILAGIEPNDIQPFQFFLEHRIAHRFPCVALSTYSSEAIILEALRSQFRDFVSLPCTASALSARLELHMSPAPVTRHSRIDRIIGESAAMHTLRRSIQCVSSVQSTVLLTGETGTGKELAAQTIHESSSRAAGPFIAVNCAAMPDSLLESELFGYQKGAFTGALTSRVGLLQAADGGTIFLDEVADMSAYAQAKVLRALETRRIQRLGGNQEFGIDVRVIAATNRDVERMVDRHEFREDLYFRLNVVRVHLPPLRERREDIGELVAMQVRRLNASSGRSIEGASPDAMERLVEYHWPGNVRELRNVTESAFVFCATSVIDVEDLPPHIQAIPGGQSIVSERERLLFVLRSTDWNKSKAAEQLKCSRMTLYRKLARYGLESKP